MILRQGHICFSLASVIALVIFSSNLLSAQEDVPNRDDYNLQGNVKSVRYRSYEWEYVKDKPHVLKKSYRESMGNIYVEFDEDGERVKDTIEIGYGHKPQVDLYYYDSIGNLVSSETLAPNGSVQSKDVWSYDGEIPTGYKSYIFGKLHRYSQYNHDLGARKTMKMNYYAKDSSVTSRVFMEYDKNGNLIHKLHRAGAGYQLSNTFFSYDDRGNEIESKSVNSNGSIGTIIRKTYDEESVLVLEQRVDKEGKELQRSEYTYDGFGNLTYEKVVIADKPELRGKHDTKIVYKYDDQGNWVTREKYYGGEAEGLTKASYVYF